jgi:hypothetical protein
MDESFMSTTTGKPEAAFPPKSIYYDPIEYQHQAAAVPTAGGIIGAHFGGGQGAPSVGGGGNPKGIVVDWHDSNRDATGKSDYSAKIERMIGHLYLVLMAGYMGYSLYHADGADGTIAWSSASRTLVMLAMAAITSAAGVLMMTRAAT